MIAVRLTDGNKQLIIGTKHASLIRFDENTLRPLGRTATGVKGITLREGDEVIGLDVIESNDEHEVLIVTENGYGKRTKKVNTEFLTVVVKELRRQQLLRRTVTSYVLRP